MLVAGVEGFVNPNENSGVLSTGLGRSNEWRMGCVRGHLDSGACLPAREEEMGRTSNASLYCGHLPLRRAGVSIATVGRATGTNPRLKEMEGLFSIINLDVE